MQPYRDAVGEVLGGRAQTTSGQGGRLQPVGQAAQLLHGRGETGDGMLDLAAQGVLAPVDPGRLQAQRDRQQALLGAVVQVALHPAPLLEVGLRQPGPRLAHLLDLPGQLGPQGQVVDLRGRPRDDRVDRAALVACGVVGEGGRHPPVADDVEMTGVRLHRPAVSRDPSRTRREAQRGAGIVQGPPDHGLDIGGASREAVLHEPHGVVTSAVEPPVDAVAGPEVRRTGHRGSGQGREHRGELPGLRDRDGPRDHQHHHAEGGNHRTGGEGVGGGVGHDPFDVVEPVPHDGQAHPECQRHDTGGEDDLGDPLLVEVGHDERQDDAGTERHGPGDEPEELTTCLAAGSSEREDHGHQGQEEAPAEQQDRHGADQGRWPRQRGDCPRADQLLVRRVEMRAAQQGGHLEDHGAADGDQWQPASARDRVARGRGVLEHQGQEQEPGHEAGVAERGHERAARQVPGPGEGHRRVGVDERAPRQARGEAEERPAHSLGERAQGHHHADQVAGGQCDEERQERHQVGPGQAGGDRVDPPDENGGDEEHRGGRPHHRPREVAPDPAHGPHRGTVRGRRTPGQP